MTEQNANTPRFPESRAALGQQLRERREARGLGREDLALRLKLRPDIVDALERGSYTSLGAPVFVRGYLRSYAGEVDLPATELAAVIESLGEAPILGPSPVTVRRNPWIERYSLAGTYLVGTVLVMSIFWAVVQTEGFGLMARLGKPPELLDVASPTVSTPETALVLPGPELPATDVAVADGFEDDDAEPTPDTSADVTPGRAAPVMASMVPTLDRGEARFSVRVAADTWMDIRDGNGKRIKYDIQKSGEQEYRGQPPFELRIGNASKAELLIDGRGIDLAPFSRREIARLKLVADAGALTAEELPRKAETRDEER